MARRTRVDELKFGEEDTLERNEHRCTVGQRDQELQLALSGDQEALGCLLGSYMPRLYRIALRILGTPQDAEDALQDGLVQVLKHVREFEGRSQFSTWLTRIVINAALMRLRRRRHEVTTSMDHQAGQDDHPSLADSIRDSQPNPEEAYAQKEWLQMFRRTLWTLPAKHGSALWLRDVQGMSTREAAEALGIQEGSLKTNLHRARLSLGAELSGVRSTHKALRANRSDATTTRRRPKTDLIQEVTSQAA